MSGHEEFLTAAIRLAEDSVAAGGGPFGAVIVRDGAIIARGVNRVTASNDPTAHAEVEAIRAACAALGDFQLTGCVIYASCEPCPMCLAAVQWARLDRVYYAATTHDAASAGFDDSVFYDELALPPEDRAIPVRHLEVPEAGGPFAAWRAREDRVEY